MKSLNNLHYAALLLILFLMFSSCGNFNKVFRDIKTKDSFQLMKSGEIAFLKQESPYLKIHMQNGNVYLLKNWNTDKPKQNISGNGFLFNMYRDTIAKGEFNVALDSVSIFESNVISASGTATALTVYTGITGIMAGICITNPKACFGSCPTFYIKNSSGYHLRAEGFSSSISPSLEATDLDALFIESEPGAKFSIEMKNEALETHVIRSVNLLAVPKSTDSRVFKDSQNNFWESGCQLHPNSAIADEGNIVSLISYADGIERFSKTDSNYLGTKEIIDLEFEALPQQDCGIVLGTRQSLLSTYLLYQTFAYMGKDVGYWFSQIEKGKLKNRVNPIENILGGIEVMKKDSEGSWKTIEVIDEQGPLAADFHFIPLKNFGGGKDKIRLCMTKGNWRIDYIALAVNTKPVDALRITPSVVMKDSLIDVEARSILSDSIRSITTLPGDKYTLEFNLPKNSKSYELFLESRGYYLEWIRKEWMAEENPFYLSQMFLKPEEALHRLAPEFKKVEGTMEEYFWSSKYAKP